jgi:organic hydroperoxide reductase OsmC/OhrA
MTTISVTEFETRLQWLGEQQATLTTEQAPTLAIGGLVAGQPPSERWAPETLLVAAAESRILLSFLEQARAQGIEILFYQSSAMGRRVGSMTGQPHFTDLIVRPHVAVRDEVDVERVRRIFEQLPPCCFPSSMLQLTPRIEPVVEIWNGRRPPERGVPPARETNASL